MKNATAVCRYTYMLLFVLLSHNTQAQVCSDVNATAETKALYKKLYTLSKQQIIFGHQDALAYGVGWKYVPGKSDIKSMVNDNPGLYGWDIAHIELDSLKNIDGVPFNKMQQYIKDGYKRGAAITISWHLRNPLSGGSAWDTTAGAVASVLPGGIKHEMYKGWLDKVAVFMNGLKGSNGEMIPVLFRPFHELTGNWFWWCKNVSSPEDIKKLWQFTISYLQKEKNIHHLIYVYNTADFDNEVSFLERYPGDDMVDLVSFDMYQFGEKKEQREKFMAKMRNQLTILTKIAAQKNKVAALAETGFEAIPDRTWWTETLWPIIKDFPLSYVLVWRNHGWMPSTKKMHYYAPYPGQVSEKDFKVFYWNPKIIFEKKLGKQKIYQ